MPSTTEQRIARRRVKHDVEQLRNLRNTVDATVTQVCRRYPKITGASGLQSAWDDHLHEALDLTVSALENCKAE